MEIPVEQVADIAVLVIPGDRLEAKKAAEFKHQIKPILQKHHRVVFDMSQLLFVDSSGLGAILSCLRQLNDDGGDLKLCAMTKQVRAIYELVRMHRVFEIFQTKDDAIRAFQRG